MIFPFYARIQTLSLVALFTGIAAAAEPAVEAKLADLSALQAQATPFHVKLALPTFENTAEAIQASANKTIQDANADLDRLAKQDRSKVTFASSLVALDEIKARVRNVEDRIGLLQEAHPEKSVRDAAAEVSVQLSSWDIELDYREDVYRVLKAYAETHPKLRGEDKLLFDETLRDYRRAGLALPEDQRKAVEKLRKELTQLTTDFTTHINEARAPLDFSEAELEGVPASFLASPGVRQADGHYRVMLNITWHAEAIGENAKNEDVRKRAWLARNSLAKDTNVALLTKIVALRTDIAIRLGYPTWADYQTETRMAKTAATAVKFEDDLVVGLQSKYTGELAELQKLKAEETKNPDAKIEAWDINYYISQLKKQRYAVDTEQLRVYFPYQAALNGMFRIYEKIFGLTFTQINPPQVWFSGVQLFEVTDSSTHQPLGLFYLDMFPREGKYNHFACFTVSEGVKRTDGMEEVPVASLLCNFPPPSADQPSLLKHNDVETLFHEFGHVMHLVLSRSKFPRHYAFGVPQDFVEAPSQMLENWVWDKTVLDTFAADYRDPSKKVPAEVIDALVKARKATSGLVYRRQLSFGVLDLDLHMQKTPSDKLDIVTLTNNDLTRIWVNPGPGTAFVAYFGHIAGGYDAGYYGYLWSLAIAQDMASVFKKSKDGFLDEKIGHRLRNEIYGVGASRDITESVEHFLGRKQSLKPFLDFVGVQ